MDVLRTLRQSRRSIERKLFFFKSKKSIKCSSLILLHYLSKSIIIHARGKRLESLYNVHPSPTRPRINTFLV